MDESRPFTLFLAWLIAEPARIEDYRTAEKIDPVVDKWEEESGLTLSKRQRSILRNNNLVGATNELIVEARSENVMCFLIRMVR